MKLFHGGCHDCTMQDKLGMGYCVGCQYFNADWKLPDLNDSHIKKEKKLNKLRGRAVIVNRIERFISKILNIVFCLK